MPTAPKAPEAAVHANLATALAAFQAHLPTVVKGNTAKVATKTGGSYSYDYADLTDVSAIVLPALARQGLAWITALDTEDGNIVLRWTLAHGPSGGTITGTVPVGRAGQDWQTLGGAVTYARRYCLVAATGVAPGGDDNDGVGAQAGQAPAQRPAPQRPAPIAQASGPLPEDLYRLSALASLEDVQNMYRQARAAGHLGLTIPVADDQGTLVDTPFSEVLSIIANRFKAQAPDEAVTAQAPQADEDAPDGDR